MARDRRVARVATLSRRLRWAVRIILALVVIGLLVVFAALTLGIEPGPVRMTAGGGMEIGLEGVSKAGRLALLASILPALAIVLAIFHQTDRLLGLYARGDIFGREHAHRIRWSGQLMMLLAVVDLLMRPLLFLVAGAVGADVHDAAFDLNFGLLLAGAFVLLIGHVMSVGADLAEEQSLTI